LAVWFHALAPASSAALVPGLLHPHALEFFVAFVFLAGFLAAMNSPDFLLRLVYAVAPPSFVFT